MPSARSSTSAGIAARRRGRGGNPEDAPVRVPRLDVRAGRSAAVGAPLGGARRRRRPRAGRDPPRCLGPVPVRQPRRRGAAARGGLGEVPAMLPRAASTSTVSRSTTASTGRSRRTGRSRPRTSSSATTAPSRIPASRHGRDLARRVPARAQALAPEPVRAAEGPDRRAAARGPVPPALAEHGDQRLSGQAEPLDRPDPAARARPDPQDPRLLLRPNEDDAWIAEFLEFDDQVGREDARLVESVQRGAGSGAIPEGRLLPDSEQLVAAFQARVSEAVDGGASRRA